MGNNYNASKDELRQRVLKNRVSGALLGSILGIGLTLTGLALIGAIMATAVLLISLAMNEDLKKGSKQSTFEQKRNRYDFDKLLLSQSIVSGGITAIATGTILWITMQNTDAIKPLLDTPNILSLPSEATLTIIIGSSACAALGLLRLAVPNLKTALLSQVKPNHMATDSKVAGSTLGNVLKASTADPNAATSDEDTEHERDSEVAPYDKDTAWVISDECTAYADGERESADDPNHFNIRETADKLWELDDDDHNESHSSNPLEHR